MTRHEASHTPYMISDRPNMNSERPPKESNVAMTRYVPSHRPHMNSDRTLIVIDPI